MTTDTGYHSNRSRSPGRESAVENRRSEVIGGSQVPAGTSLEKPGFKTREEFQRDFERRERELKELLSERPRQEVLPRQPREEPLPRQPREETVVQDSLGTTTRSDPGGALDDGGSRWEYRVSDHAPEFKRLEPELAYPQDRLRYSRSKSDTDLVALSPSDSLRYSSPKQPGKF